MSELRSPHRSEISSSAATAILCEGIREIVEYPACVDFVLDDERVLAVYDGIGGKPRRWVLERKAAPATSGVA